jgi:hypothetical protein
MPWKRPALPWSGIWESWEAGLWKFLVLEEEFVMVLSKELSAAITTAVLTYIKTQEELQVAFAPVRPAEVPPVSVSFWAASGRQAMMDMRRTLQLGLTRF